MKPIHFAFLIFLIFSSAPLKAIDTTAAKFYPTDIGNIYVYLSSDYWPYGSSSSYKKTIIVKDSVFNNHKYFLFQDFPSNYKRWRRVDSVTTNIMEYDPSNGCPFYGYEVFIDSLRAKSGDSENGVCNDGHEYCRDTSYASIFGIPSQHKEFYWITAHAAGNHYYAKYIGYYQTSYSAVPSSHGSTQLTGCVLKGIVYGDTVIYPNGLTEINTEVPKAFRLNQNYPNPFNPVTVITFEIKEESDVQITVYDNTGREVSKLVNQTLGPAAYKVTWSAENLSGGIYFYRLTAGNFSDTKKMVLLK